MTEPRLADLRIGQHMLASDLLNQVQDNLLVLSRLVSLEPYSETALRIRQAVQEQLIDPLHAAWAEKSDWDDNPHKRVA